MNKNKLIDIFLKYPLCYFAIYLFYLAKPNIELIYPKMEHFFSLFHYLLIFWGILIIIYNFYFNRKIIKKNSFFIVCIFLSSLFTVLYNFRIISFDSLKVIFLTNFITCIFIFSYSLLKERYDKKIIIKYLFYPLFILKFIMDLISLILYISNISVYIINDKIVDFFGIRYVELINGSYTALLYGVYKDPNYLALSAISLLIFSLYIIKFNFTNIVERVLLILFIIIEFLILLFTNSRGGMYSIYFVLILFIFFNIVKLFIKIISKKQFFKLMVNYVSVIILLFVSSVVVKNIGFSIFNSTKPSSYVILHSKGDFNLYKLDDYEKLKGSNNNKIVHNNNINITINKENSSKDLGNGRISIWKESFKLYTYSPIFGLGPNMQKISVKQYKINDLPQMLEGRAYHNSYIHQLLSFGIFGLLIWLVYLGYIMMKIVKLEIKNYLVTDRTFLLFLFLILSFGYLFLDGIFINVSFENCIFLFLLSFLIEEYRVFYRGKNEN